MPKNTFIERELSHGKESEEAWFRYQEYTYENNPTDKATDNFTTREQEPRQSHELTFSGRIASDVFPCDKQLLSGVTLRILFVRSKP